MDGSVIGENSVVEPGSFVPNDTQIPPKQVWSGKPARYVRSLSDEEVLENSKLSKSQQELGKKHNEIQQNLLLQKEDYSDETYYHKE